VRKSLIKLEYDIRKYSLSIKESSKEEERNKSSVDRLENKNLSG
jgi:hypothetical protein